MGKGFFGKKVEKKDEQSPDMALEENSELEESGEDLTPRS